MPLLEQAGFETWAIDILGWSFSNLEFKILVLDVQTPISIGSQVKCCCFNSFSLVN